MFESLNKYPKSLRISIIEGMMGSIMYGGGFGFIMAFAVYLGANSTQAVHARTCDCDGCRHDGCGASKEAAIGTKFLIEAEERRR